MKTINKILSIIAFAALTISCVDNIALPGQAGDDVFTASIGAATKTFIDEDMNVLWTDNDRISIFRDNNINLPYALRSGSGTTNAEFVPDLDGDSFYAGSKVEKGYGCNYAIYPYSTKTFINNSWIYLDLPATQQYRENSFAPNSNPMYAVTTDAEDHNLGFRNLCGVLRIRLLGDREIERITLMANNPLTGMFAVRVNAGEEPEIVPVNGATSNSLDIECMPPVMLSPEEPTDFWFVIPPAHYRTGFDIQVIATDGSIMVASIHTSVEITRSSIITTEYIPFNEVQGPTLIKFADPAFEEFLAQATVDATPDGEPIDMNGDSRISFEEALRVTHISLWDYKGIFSIGGIEAFKNLKDLQILYNNLSSANLSENVKLENVTLARNRLVSVSLPDNDCLEFVNLSNNELKWFSFPSSIRYVELDHNLLEEVEFNGYSNENSYIDLTNNYLTGLDIEGLTFNQLIIGDNFIKKLDAHKANVQFFHAQSFTQDHGIPLETLYISYAQSQSMYAMVPETTEIIIWDYDEPLVFRDKNLERALVETDKDGRIDADGNGVITRGEARDVQVISLNASGYNIRSFEDLAFFPNLQLLDITDNSDSPVTVNSLDLTCFPSLMCLSTNGIQVKEYAFADAGSAFDTLIINGNDAVEDLNLSGFIQATSIVLQEDANLSGITLPDPSVFLSSLQIEYTAYEGPMVLDRFPNLNKLRVGHNNIKSLMLSGCTMLKLLECNDNLLTTLEVNDCPKITTFNCANNMLDGFDFSLIPNVSTVNVSGNQGFDLNLSGASEVRKLACSNIGLEMIDISHLMMLYNLDCSFNNIRELDVRVLNKLHNLDCSPMENEEGVNVLSRVLVCDYQKITGVYGIGVERDSNMIPDGTELVVYSMDGSIIVPSY